MSLHFMSFSVNGCLGCVLLLLLCACEVVLVPCVDAVVAVTLMRVLLFMLHVCMLRGCEGDGNAGVGDGGGEVVVSAGQVGGTRCSCIVSSVADVLRMSGVGGGGV